MQFKDNFSDLLEPCQASQGDLFNCKRILKTMNTNVHCCGHYIQDIHISYMILDLRERLLTKNIYIWKSRLTDHVTAIFLLPGLLVLSCWTIFHWCWAISPHSMRMNEMSQIWQHLLISNKYLCEIVGSVLLHIHHVKL